MDQRKQATVRALKATQAFITPHDVQLNARNPWRMAAETIDRVRRQCRV